MRYHGSGCETSEAGTKNGPSLRIRSCRDGAVPGADDNGSVAARRPPGLGGFAEVDLIDDNAGKPVGIHQAIGRRPIAAFGNSDGDFERLEWVTSEPGPRWAPSSITQMPPGNRPTIGRLERGLDEAATRRWVLVETKQDWKRIYPEEARQ